MCASFARGDDAIAMEGGGVDRGGAPPSPRARVGWGGGDGRAVATRARGTVPSEASGGARGAATECGRKRAADVSRIGTGAGLWTAGITCGSGQVLNVGLAVRDLKPRAQVGKTPRSFKSATRSRRLRTHPRATARTPPPTLTAIMSGKGAKGLSGKGLSGKGAKGTMKGGDKKKPTSRSVKAGLQFPVGRIHRFLKVRPDPEAMRARARNPARRRRARRATGRRRPLARAIRASRAAFPRSPSRGRSFGMGVPTADRSFLRPDARAPPRSLVPHRRTAPPPAAASAPPPPSTPPPSSVRIPAARRDRTSPRVSGPGFPQSSPAFPRRSSRCFGEPAARVLTPTPRPRPRRVPHRRGSRARRQRVQGSQGAPPASSAPPSARRARAPAPVPGCDRSRRRLLRDGKKTFRRRFSHATRLNSPLSSPARPPRPTPGQAHHAPPPPARHPR